MRIGHPSWLPVLLAALPLGTAVAAGPRPAAAQLFQPAGVTQARALEIARQRAALDGYAFDDYHVASIEQREDGTWVVFLEHDPPAAPGRHCTVYVAADGSTRLIHGR